MRICIISDTHNQHRKLQLPDADLLIHCGDFQYSGSEGEFANFRDWWRGLDRPRILVPGNHDLSLYRYPGMADELRGKESFVLIDQTIQWHDQVIHGTPWVPKCGPWAWMFHDHSPDPGFPFQIPQETTILISHGPAFGIRDKVAKGFGSVGSYKLRDRIDALPALRLHCFGHIHEGYGVEEVNGTIHANAAVLDEQYKLVNPPLVVEI